LLGLGGMGAIYVDDGSVRVERRGFVDEAFAEWALGTVLWFAQALQRAALDVPPSPAAVPYLSAFDQAARALGLGYRATPAALGGRLDGVQVWVQLTRQGPSQLGCDLYAQHASQLGLGLELRPRRGSAFLLFASPDIEVGDPRFDDRFDIHGRDPEGVRRLLDGEIRARVDARSASTAVSWSTTSACASRWAARRIPVRSCPRCGRCVISPPRSSSARAGPTRAGTAALIAEPSIESGRRVRAGADEVALASALR
jgi:hypothetical protein